MITKYNLKFILHSKNSTSKLIKSALAEFGDNLSVDQTSEHKEVSDYAVQIVTEDPTLVFDLCAQFGRIRSIKVEEIKVKI